MASTPNATPDVADNTRVNPLACVSDKFPSFAQRPIKVGIRGAGVLGERQHHNDFTPSEIAAIGSERAGGSTGSGKANFTRRGQDPCDRRLSQSK